MTDTLRVLLARKKMTMADLEEKTNVSQPTIRKIMDEMPTDVRFSTLQKIADALCVDLVVEFRPKQ